MLPHVIEMAKGHRIIIVAQRQVLERQRALGGLFIQYKEQWNLTKGTSTRTWKKDELPSLCKQLAEAAGVSPGASGALLSVSSVYRYEDIYKYWQVIVDRQWTGLSCTRIAFNLSKLKKGQHIPDDYISESEVENKLKQQRNMRSNQLVEATMDYARDLQNQLDELQSKYDEAQVRLTEIAKLKAELALRDSLLRKNNIPVPVYTPE